MDIMRLTEDILKKLLKYCDDAVVLTYRYLSNQVRFSNNKVDVFKSWRETNIEMLMEKDKKINISYITLAGAKNIDEIIRVAREALEKGREKPIYAPLPEPSKKYPKIPNKVDPSIRDKPDKLLDHVNNVISVSDKGGGRAAGSVLGRYVELALMTSRMDSPLSDEYTNIELDIRVFMDDLDTGHSALLGRRISDIDSIRVAEDALETAKLNRDQKTHDPGVYDTIMTPVTVNSVLNMVGRASSGFSALMGLSFLAGKIGKKVASQKVTIIDNPHSESSRNPRSFDDESVPTRRNIIIEKGVFTSFLHNRFTASAMSSVHTGNAGWISPHPWHLEMSPGEYSLQEMIEELKKGFIIRNLTYVRFQNYVKGDFSGILRDGVFYVENGEIKYAVKGLRLSDNVQRILENIRAISKERINLITWWSEAGVSTKAPYILVKDCRYTRPFGM